VSDEEARLTLERLYFDGVTYDPERDRERLKTLLERVFAYMLDRRWHTLAEIMTYCGGSEASVSARLRDLRKPRFGSHGVERRRHATRPGLWEYRLVPARAELQADLFGEAPKQIKRSIGYAGNPGQGPAGETCGSCQHSVRRGGNGRRGYWKCGHARGYASMSAGSDIRLKTPACQFWENA
jgi:hypothetical protein